MHLNLSSQAKKKEGKEERFTHVSAREASAKWGASALSDRARGRDRAAMSEAGGL